MLINSCALFLVLQEILITAGGENVAPVLIEDNIKAELPIISQAMVVGDRRKFLSILLTLKVKATSTRRSFSRSVFLTRTNCLFCLQTEVDVETQEPLPILTRFTREWCEEAGLSLAETVTDVIAAADRGRAERNPSADVSAQDAEAIRFVKAIEAGVERANRKAISGAQRIQKWIILPVDFSIPGGELGKIFFIFPQ